ncbi:MAG: response regulator [Leptolyngbyaceae cyanobacterium]
MLDKADTLDSLDISTPSISSANLATEQQFQAPVVLVVDDDTDSLVLACHVLEQFVCVPLCEMNGQIALDTILTHKPDLIIMDIRLPELSGLEIIRLLKRDETAHRIPIIVVTALAGRKNREAILCMGCDHYVTKPYLLKDLEKLMHSYLIRNSESSYAL